MIVISATIDYNGSTIATVTNETKVLTTGGKWVTGNIKITDVNEAPNVTQDQEGYVVLDDGGTPQTIVNPLSITSNGTYSASSGYAFNPVVVDVDGIDTNNIAQRNIGEVASGSASSVGSCAFAYCNSLTIASFPYCNNIYDSAFYKCTSLTTLSFPSCISFSSYVFAYCSNLTSVDFSVCTRIGYAAFLSCLKLSTVNFPTCTNIESNAFASCVALESVDFPLCIYIGNYAFEYCTHLSMVNFPECTSIPVYGFYYCVALESVNFPKCSIIARNAFVSCSVLSNVRFTSCYNISGYAFSGCDNLSTVIFNHTLAPQGIIYDYAFHKCFNLLSIYLLASTIYKLSGTSVFYSTPISTYTTSTGGVPGSIFVPASLYDAYISSTNWSLFSSRFVSLTESQVSYVMEHGTHIIS